MPTTQDLMADNFVAWAQTLPGVSTSQLERIKHLVPKLTSEELRQLKATLERNEEDQAKAKEVLAQVAVRQTDYISDERRETRENKEAIEQAQDAANADQLFTKI
ncbi:MAG: hypothetical protein AAB383_03530 [Patescibacteria group bacterium]